MEKKRLWIAVIIAVVLVGAVCWFINDRNSKQEAAHHLTLSGNVDVREVTLAFRSSDRIESLRFAIDALRRIYLEGAGLKNIYHDFIPMLTVAFITLPFAGWLFRNKTT
ncbi:MAG: hypothetical protein K6F62_04775 [Schwartzia sp.]|nr:hypothetical protein [Schwartzia sp. (in: firmicutes)]